MLTLYVQIVWGFRNCKGLAHACNGHRPAGVGVRRMGRPRGTSSSPFMYGMSLDVDH